MAKIKTSSVRVDSKIWREAKLLAVSRGITIGSLVEKLLRRELNEAKKKGWKVNEEH